MSGLIPAGKSCKPGPKATGVGVGGTLVCVGIAVAVGELVWVEGRVALSEESALAVLFSVFSRPPDVCAGNVHALSWKVRITAKNIDLVFIGFSF